MATKTERVAVVCDDPDEEFTIVGPASLMTLYRLCPGNQIVRPGDPVIKFQRSPADDR